MTLKEALGKLFIVCDTNLSNDSRIKKQVNMLLNFSEIAQIEQILLDTLNELEELKRDVKRFMELMDKYMTFVFLCDEETNDEYDKLSKKLMKVGNEE